MSDILRQILERKHGEVQAAKRRVPPDALAARAAAVVEPRRGFRTALAAATTPAVIAELKRRSPSRGEIRPEFDPGACAAAYHAGGAAALSVLTDEHYFGGRLDYLGIARREVPLALLRKDFTIDPYQIDEALVAGADAVLLIVAALAEDALAELAQAARARGLDCLVEVHDERELEAALAVGADLVGVNNRDLGTFEVDLGTTERVAKALPAHRDVLLVTESGIGTHADVERLARAGARAFLVGESLMREPDIARALRLLRLGRAA